MHTPCAVATRNDRDAVVNFFVVCGSFVFAQARGYIGRYCTYTGDGFQEGVSLTAADEVIRLRKYAYGSCEIMLNKFTVSCTRLPGPLARSGMALTGVTFGERGGRAAACVHCARAEFFSLTGLIAFGRTAPRPSRGRDEARCQTSSAGLCFCLADVSAWYVAWPESLLRCAV